MRSTQRVERFDALYRRLVAHAQFCGRAIWQDGIAAYAQDGASALNEWLRTTSQENITRVNNALKAAQCCYA
jgi:tagatose-1,6-bisphosphate aldolase